MTPLEPPSLSASQLSAFQHFPTKPLFGHALEEILGLSAVPSLWRSELRHDYDTFGASFLEPKTYTVISLPCPTGRCGCWHKVAPQADGLFIGTCQCNPRRCPDLHLSTADVTPLKLNWPKLGRAIARALGCATKILDLPIPNTMQVGAWSTDAVPVILTIQQDEYNLQSVISHLHTRLDRPFILLSPTTDNLDAAGQELLAHARAGFFALDTIVRPTEHGTFLPLVTPGDLFIKFAPDPNDSVGETIARQALALVKALDSQYKFRKAPLSKVFLLYCSEGLDAKQTAKRCKCGRTLIFDRLKLLKRKLGRHPSELRQYSSHLEHQCDAASGA